MEVVAVTGRAERNRGGGHAIWRTCDRCCVIWVGTTHGVGGVMTCSPQSLPRCLRPTDPLPANTFSHFLILRADPSSAVTAGPLSRMALELRQEMEELPHPSPPRPTQTGPSEAPLAEPAPAQAKAATTQAVIPESSKVLVSIVVAVC